MVIHCGDSEPQEPWSAGRDRANDQAHPSDLTDEEWSRISPLLPGAARRGRKRHIAIDTDGRLLMVNLTTADISDRAGAHTVIDVLHKRWPWIRHPFAHGASDRRQMLENAALIDLVVEIVRRSDPGFAILPKHWVVERTFGSPTRYRRLVQEDEARIDVSAAMTNSLVRRIGYP
jgi:transposase